jgi:hypothetical protein
MPASPLSIANQIRRALRAGARPERTSSVQRFFTEKVDTYGWHTSDLRRAIRNSRRELLKEHDLAFVLSVADLVFSGSNNQEKTAAIFLLEGLTENLDDADFVMLESWLPPIGNWSDHEGLVHYLLGPMMVE